MSPEVGDFPASRPKRKAAAVTPVKDSSRQQAKSAPMRTGGMRARARVGDDGATSASAKATATRIAAAGAAGKTATAAAAKAAAAAEAAAAAAAAASASATATAAAAARATVPATTTKAKSPAAAGAAATPAATAARAKSPAAGKAKSKARTAPKDRTMTKAAPARSYASAVATGDDDAAIVAALQLDLQAANTKLDAADAMLLRLVEAKTAADATVTSQKSELRAFGAKLHATNLSNDRLAQSFKELTATVARLEGGGAAPSPAAVAAAAAAAPPQAEEGGASAAAAAAPGMAAAMAALATPATAAAGAPAVAAAPAPVGGHQATAALGGLLPSNEFMLILRGDLRNSERDLLATARPFVDRAMRAAGISEAIAGATTVRVVKKDSRHAMAIVALPLKEVTLNTIPALCADPERARAFQRSMASDCESPQVTVLVEDMSNVCGEGTASVTSQAYLAMTLKAKVAFRRATADARRAIRGRRPQYAVGHR